MTSHLTPLTYTALLLLSWLCQSCHPDALDPFAVSTDDITAPETDCEDLQSPPTSADITGEDTTTSQTPADRMSGTWGMLLSASSKQVGIPLVKTQVTVSRNFFLVEVSPDGPTRIRTRETLCGLYIKLETFLNKSIVPEKFIEHSGVIERTIELPSINSGTPWVSDDVYEVRGARLVDPVHDPLPASGSARPGQTGPCDAAPPGSECDQDEDGQPGMTNLLSGALSCKLYVAQRWHSALAGSIVDINRIEGPLSSASTEQTVLAASSTLCEQVNMQTVEVIDKCPEHFYFKMVRLKHGASCEDVMRLTSCDESLETCDGNEELPLNPRVDDPAACK